MGILIKPVITEKMTAMSEKLNKYGFIVEKKANKLEIKRAIEQMYDVNVISVNTSNFSGKNKSRNTKARVVKGRTSSYKKAIISLSEGEIIDFYSNI